MNAEIAPTPASRSLDSLAAHGVRSPALVRFAEYLERYFTRQSNLDGRSRP